MMRCFNGESTHDYFKRMNREMREEISRLKDSDLNNTDERAWEDYFIAKYEMDPIVIYDDGKSINFTETKVKSYNTFAFNLPEGQKYIEVPGVHVTCEVPYSGSTVLLQLTPSIHSLFNPFDVAKMSEPANGEAGQLVFAEDFNQNGLNAGQINEHFDNRLQDFTQEANRCNEDAQRYNEQLSQIITEELHKRIEQLDKLATLR